MEDDGDTGDTNVDMWEEEGDDEHDDTSQQHSSAYVPTKEQEDAIRSIRLLSHHSGDAAGIAATPKAELAWDKIVKYQQHVLELSTPLDRILTRCSSVSWQKFVQIIEDSQHDRARAHMWNTIAAKLYSMTTIDSTDHMFEELRQPIHAAASWFAQCTHHLFQILYEEDVYPPKSLKLTKQKLTKTLLWQACERFFDRSIVVDTFQLCHFQWLMVLFDTISHLRIGLMEAGTSIGIIASLCLSHNMTQLVLNVFHSAGKDNNVVQGGLASYTNIANATNDKKKINTFQLPLCGLYRKNAELAKHATRILGGYKWDNVLIKWSVFAAGCMKEWPQACTDLLRFRTQQEQSELWHKEPVCIFWFKPSLWDELQLSAIELSNMLLDDMKGWADLCALPTDDALCWSMVHGWTDAPSSSSSSSATIVHARVPFIALCWSRQEHITFLNAAYQQLCVKESAKNKKAIAFAMASSSNTTTTTASATGGDNAPSATKSKRGRKTSQRVVEDAQQRRTRIQHTQLALSRAKNTTASGKSASGNGGRSKRRKQYQQQWLLDILRRFTDEQLHADAGDATCTDQLAFELTQQRVLHHILNLPIRGIHSGAQATLISRSYVSVPTKFEVWYHINYANEDERKEWSEEMDWVAGRVTATQAADEQQSSSVVKAPPPYFIVLDACIPALGTIYAALDQRVYDLRGMQTTARHGVANTHGHVAAYVCFIESYIQLYEQSDLYLAERLAEVAAAQHTSSCGRITSLSRQGKQKSTSPLDRASVTTAAKALVEASVTATTDWLRGPPERNLVGAPNRIGAYMTQVETHTDRLVALSSTQQSQSEQQQKQQQHHQLNTTGQRENETIPIASTQLSQDRLVISRLPTTALDTHQPAIMIEQFCAPGWDDM